jgi:SlyX protein
MSIETRLIDLEARIAHQDQAVNDLSNEIYQQQKQIEKLETTCKYLLDQAQQSPSTDGHQVDEKPPHY